MVDRSHTGQINSDRAMVQASPNSARRRIPHLFELGMLALEGRLTRSITVDPLHATPSEGVIDDEDHDGADHGDNHAVNIQAGDAARAERSKQPPTDEGANDAQNNIEQYPFTGLID